MAHTIFLTGASGFVGGAIANALRTKATLRAMSRSPKSDAVVTGIGASPIRCDLTNVEANHLAGCDTVIHCAAFVEQWGTREQFWQANVVGTERMLRVAREAGVKRFIHIGTEAALFRGQHMRGVDESYPYADNSPFLYSSTKAAAERRVLAANEPDFATLSIRPRFVWGPGDQTILPVLAKMVETKQFRWIDGGRARTSTTYIANLVHGVELALSQGRGGQAYFIVDAGTTTFREFLTALLATKGLTPPAKSTSSTVVQFLAATFETTWRLFRIKSAPPITRLAAAIMARDCIITSDKAARELNYEPIVSREQGLTELKSFRLESQL